MKIKNLILNSTPQELTVSDGIDSPCTISIQNTHSSENLYLGPSEVSSSEYGIRLSPGQSFSADLGPYDKIYAVGDSATVAIMILEQT